VSEEGWRRIGGEVVVVVHVGGGRSCDGVRMVVQGSVTVTVGVGVAVVRR